MGFFKSRRGRILLLYAGLGAAALVYCLLARRGIGLSCWFYQLTGLQCPGCGNSRAASALLRLDFAGALGYNLLFPVEFFYILWLLFHCTRSYLKGGRFAYHSPAPIVDYMVLGAIVVWWVVRNIL